MTAGRCPLCRTSGDIWLFLQAEQDHAAAREWVAAVATLPAAVLPHVGGYIALFNPPAKELARTKETRLLIALQRAIAAGEITRNGITWTAPLAYWEYALRHIVDNPPADLPLRNHNYLLQVVANIAAKATAQDERRQEEQRKHRPYQSTPPGAAPSADTANSSPPSQGGAARSARVVSSGPPDGWLRETVGKILGDARPQPAARETKVAADPRGAAQQRLCAIAERLCELNASATLPADQRAEIAALQQEEQHLSQSLLHLEPPHEI